MEVFIGTDVGVRVGDGGDVGAGVFKVKGVEVASGVGVDCGVSVSVGVGKTAVKLTLKLFESPLVGLVLFPLNLLKVNR
jgi:hypothetical protein